MKTKKKTIGEISVSFYPAGSEAAKDRASMGADATNLIKKQERLRSHAALFKDLSLLNILDEREREIIVHHYGLDGSEEKTLSEVGKILGMTRQRVHQLEQIAIEKIKKAKKSKVDARAS